MSAVKENTALYDGLGECWGRVMELRHSTRLQRNQAAYLAVKAAEDALLSARCALEQAAKEMKRRTTRPTTRG